MPSVLVVDSDREVVRAFRIGFAEAEARVLSSRSGDEAVEIVARHHPDVVVMDTVLPDGSGLEIFRRIRLRDPGIPVIFMTASGTANTAIEAIALRGLRLRGQAAGFGQDSRVGRTGVQGPPRSARAAGARRRGATPWPATPWSAAARPCRRSTRPSAASPRRRSTSDPRRERHRQGIGGPRHPAAQSAGRQRQFLAVNCAAIPEPLLESELFGHEKGAFTGADSKRIGKFEQCSGGTLFLDEVGDMTPLMQSKVLRVLQEGRFERVGGNDTIETDVRIIAATNRDLEQMVADGQFRADLYYRLNVFSIQVPPLRERTIDSRCW